MRDIKDVKKQLKTDNDELKADISILQQMISTVEEFIIYGNESNVSEYDKRLERLEDKLKVVRL